MELLVLNLRVQEGRKITEMARAFISLLRMIKWLCKENEDFVDGVENGIGDGYDGYVNGPDGHYESISCHRKLT